MHHVIDCKTKSVSLLCMERCSPGRKLQRTIITFRLVGPDGSSLLSGATTHLN